MIASRRVQLRMSVREVGRRSGLSAMYVSRLERGHYRQPGPDALRALAFALRLPLRDLIDQNNLTNSPGQAVDG